MKLKAKLVHKYDEKNGVGKNTGTPWRRQDMKFVIMRDDWTESSESIVVSCMNDIYLDAPALAVGSIGVLSFWASADEYNGSAYNHFNLNGWTPQNEVNVQAAQSVHPATPVPAVQAAPAQAQQFTPEQLAAAAAMIQQAGGKLPF